MIDKLFRWHWNKLNRFISVSLSRLPTACTDSPSTALIASNCFYLNMLNRSTTVLLMLMMFTGEGFHQGIQIQLLRDLHKYYSSKWLIFQSCNKTGTSSISYKENRNIIFITSLAKDQKITFLRILYVFETPNKCYTRFKDVFFWSFAKLGNNLYFRCGKESDARFVAGDDETSGDFLFCVWLDRLRFGFICQILREKTDRAADVLGLWGWLFSSGSFLIPIENKKICSILS